MIQESFKRLENHPYDLLSWLAVSRFLELWERRDMSILICCVGKWAALKHGIRNPKTETESWKRKRKRNTESNINDSKLKNFTLHNLSTIQREFVLVFLAVPLNIFLLLCLDKVCRSVGYCTARPMKVILRVIFIHEFMGWIIQLNITFVANCQE